MWFLGLLVPRFAACQRRSEEGLKRPEKFTKMDAATRPKLQSKGDLTGYSRETCWVPQLPVGLGALSPAGGLGLRRYLACRLRCVRPAGSTVQGLGFRVQGLGFGV